ncbi:MAG TPA: hypothetical protein VGA78_02275 [Gemmatimonadales bacterium]
MAKRTRYKLEKVEVFPADSRPASWTFAGAPVRGVEHTYLVNDTNVDLRKRQWEFIVRVPEERNGRVEVRPRTVPNVTAWAELPDRSLTFMPATRGAAKGRWYCQVALADASGEKSKAVVRAEQRDELPSWFREVDSHLRRKETVRPTQGTDANALVALVAAGDHAAMIRLFFATKVWILSEKVVL